MIQTLRNLGFSEKLISYTREQTKLCDKINSILKIPNRTIVPKKWGFEVHVINNEYYCLKYLVLLPGGFLGTHYHKKKNETFLLEEGSATLITFFKGKSIEIQQLKVGDSKFIKRLLRHNCYSENGAVIMEVSTHDHAKDSYRLQPRSTNVRFF